MIIATAVQLFKILKERLGENEAEVLVEFVDSRLKENNSSNLKILATKEDMQNLKLDISEDIQNLKIQIAENKAEIIKWMFIFWIGQVAVTFGFILLFLKK